MGLRNWARGLRRVGLGLIAMVIVATGSVAVAEGSSSTGAASSTTKKIAPGVFYTKTRDPSGPYRIFVLSIKTNKPSTLDTVLATDRLPGHETTSSMAARSGALAAINGDYATFTGRPVYAFARDGWLDQTPTSWGRNFSMTRDETGSFIGHPTTDGFMFDPATGLTYIINRVNEGPPGFNHVAMYTPAGGSEEKPPPDACSARFYPIESPQFRAVEPGVEALHYVDEVLCSAAPMPRQGGIVVSAPATGGQAAVISSLVVGQQMVLGWTLGWTGVFDTIGGNPTLIENGAIQTSNVTGSTPFHGRNPRTGVGTTPDGRVLLVAVDGRQPGYSVGMSLLRFAQLFQSLGATWALNLDGGGSTTFVVNGVIKNRPSDGSERPVSSALVLLPGPDPGELPSPKTPAVTPKLVWRKIAQDPGSTGGLASWLASEGRPLPASLEAAARAFDKTATNKSDTD
jgi:hypothetical protein